QITTYEPNALNQYVAVSGHDTPGYDGRFNLTHYDGWTYSYDADNRLISASGTANGQFHSALFVYDGAGRCVKRTIDGIKTEFTYDGWKPVAEWPETGALFAWNLYGSGDDEILVRKQPSTRDQLTDDEGYVYYHLDAFGNVQFLLGETNKGL